MLGENIMRYELDFIGANATGIRWDKGSQNFVIG